MARRNHPPNLKPKTPRRPQRVQRILLIVLTLGVIAVLGFLGTLIALEPDRLPRFATMIAGPTVAPTEAEPVGVPSITPYLTPTPVPSVTLPPGVTPSATPDVTATPPPVADGELREAYVPILMYHYVSVPPVDADEYRVDLSTAPDAFRRQMTWLRDNGYEVISLQTLLYALNTGSPELPQHPVVLTFDDGYTDNYENAFPVLEEFGYPATFFILTDVTDRAQPGYMTWAMLREMSDAGLDIEVHGREHVEMTGRDADWLYYHLHGPAETINVKLGYTPHILSYPSGQYDQSVIDAAQQVGYWAAVTTVQGGLQSSASPFELRRLRVRGEWDVATFAAILREFSHPPE